MKVITSFFRAISESPRRITSGLIIDTLWKYQTCSKPATHVSDRHHPTTSETTRTLCPCNPVHERRLCSDYLQLSEATSTYPPVNQGLNKSRHRSYYLCDRCVHIFDRLQLRLLPPQLLCSGQPATNGN